MARETAAESRTPASLDALSDVSSAVEAGAGLPEVARAAARALEASVVVVDSGGAMLATACASPDDERRVIAVAEGTETLPLTVAESQVGELRYRARAEEPPPAALLRMVAALIALEVDRSRAPERATEAALAGFLADVLERRTTDRDNIVARGRELGAELAEGGSVVIVRSRPQGPQSGDWRGRVLAGVEAVTRGAAPGALTAALSPQSGPRRSGANEDEVVVLVPGRDDAAVRRAATGIARELEARFPDMRFAVARSRPAGDPIDLHRAAAEAILAANVAEAQGGTLLAFEDTGAYRLLLPAVGEDAAELERFHEETVAPIVAYDEQYETELVRTLETFLDVDGSVARAAERLFTHRHTIRYRLERVRELTGLDVSSTDGRERLGLGLKAMRVLGIAAPHGPATEPGAEAGQVPRERTSL
jgi:DNA-binding PucR family transcriptional regulator